MDATRMQHPLEGPNGPGTCAISRSSPVPRHTAVTTVIFTTPTAQATQEVSGGQLGTEGKVISLCIILLIIAMISYLVSPGQYRVERWVDNGVGTKSDFRAILDRQATRIAALERGLRDLDVFAAARVAAKNTAGISEAFKKLAIEAHAKAQTARANAAAARAVDDAAAADGARAGGASVAEDDAKSAEHILNHLRVAAWNVNEICARVQYIAKIHAFNAAEDVSNVAKVSKVAKDISNIARGAYEVEMERLVRSVNASSGAQPRPDASSQSREEEK